MKRWRWLALPVVVVPVTLVLIVPMMIAALVKLVVPVDAVRTACRRIVVWIAERWLDVLVGLFRRVLDTRIDVSGDASFDRSCSYVLICNHQSWVDVPVVLTVFHGRLPFWRFFLKRGLIWMPLLGLAFWALEYPFVRFPSRETLERFPERRGENLRTARRAIEHLQGRATTVVNFPEGAIFTPEKHRAQRARYRHLLRPRAGGTALMLAAFGDRLDALIDVTLDFPGGRPSLWDFVTNRVDRVVVHVATVRVPPELTRGDYENDPAFRRRFQDWLNALWRAKDERLHRMRRLESYRAAGRGEAGRESET
jgi:1-acyl-sn-glycerol-3-phosphate acyltransferase